MDKNFVTETQKMQSNFICVNCRVDQAKRIHRYAGSNKPVLLDLYYAIFR